LPTTIELLKVDRLRLPVSKPPAPPPPPKFPPPAAPPATIKYSTGKEKVVPFLASFGVIANVEVPTDVKVCIRYPPAVVTLPPVIEELEVLGMNLGNGLLDRPKLPLTLLTKGIYFSLEVEVSRT
jgi:hypothetical protein